MASVGSIALLFLLVPASVRADASVEQMLSSLADGPTEAQDFVAVRGCLDQIGGKREIQHGFGESVWPNVLVVAGRGKGPALVIPSGSNQAKEQEKWRDTWGYFSFTSAGAAHFFACGRANLGVRREERIRMTRAKYGAAQAKQAEAALGWGARLEFPNPEALGSRPAWAGTDPSKPWYRPSLHVSGPPDGEVNGSLTDWRLEKPPCFASEAEKTTAHTSNRTFCPTLPGGVPATDANHVEDSYLVCKGQGLEGDRENLKQARSALAGALVEALGHYGDFIRYLKARAGQKVDGRPVDEQRIFEAYAGARGVLSRCSRALSHDPNLRALMDQKIDESFVRNPEFSREMQLFSQKYGGH
jgi:hypothetical protein